MQKEPKPVTPKPNGTRRPRNTGTPDARHRNPSADVTMSSMNRTTNIRHRTTMVPGDIMISSGSFAKRRIGNTARLNTTLSQISTGQVPLKAEVESSENELGLLYDKYLQAEAMEILVKKKIDEKRRAINVQMAAVAKEKALVIEKFQAAKLRENDIRYSNLMQASIDAQTAHVDHCFDDLVKNKMKEKLLELKTLVEPLDGLRCPGIIIAENTEDRKELFDSLEDISDNLERIQESSGDKGKVYRNIEKGLNDLIRKHLEIETVKKKLDEDLCGAQVLVLKHASHSLTPNYTDELN